jgi:hypothetical protein
MSAACWIMRDLNAADQAERAAMAASGQGVAPVDPDDPRTVAAAAVNDLYNRLAGAVQTHG